MPPSDLDPVIKLKRSKVCKKTKWEHEFHFTERKKYPHFSAFFFYKCPCGKIKITTKKIT